MVERKFVFACVIAALGWGSSCINERSAELLKARVRSLEIDMRNQEILNRTSDQRAQHREEYLRTAENTIERLSRERRECERSERMLRQLLNTRNERPLNQPPLLHTTVPVEPAAP